MSMFALTLTFAAVLALLLVTVLGLWLARRRQTRRIEKLNEELIAATSLLNDCTVLERATVAYLAGGDDRDVKMDVRTVGRALHALKRRGLVGDRKTQRVLFQREEARPGEPARVSAHPTSGRQSYWYRIPG